MTDRTEQWIAERVRMLLQEKPFRKIRTTEICERAEIERSTFYYHFKDKYDLTAWMFFYSAYSIDTGALMRMRDDMVLNGRTIDDTSWQQIWQYLQEYYAAYYTDRAMAVLHTDTLDPQLMFTIRLYSCGIASIIREWITGRSPVPAEVLERMMQRSLPDALHQIF